MYIKTLTIQGFKSYRDQTQIEPFSPKHNVVVGRNGSGKSNFFSAIRFVLSDAYTSMSREERQALLHEGVSVTTTLSAYVEIVFDNSDNRFPTGHDEVVIRRTIGLKKDEYSLDKKSVSKADIMNLLESAGFSKSNPYYIVPQGRITALTNAKDHERLALLKEVAGTKVYEQRRTESLKIMTETDSKRTKISELLEYIDSRLSSLEEEKEELKEYQEKDKERRCLEYALYQRELEEVAEALEDIEEERRGDVHGANVRRELFSEREKEIQDVERRIAEETHASQNLSLSRQDAQAELTDLVRSRTELECTLDDLKSAAARSTGDRDTLQTELYSLDETITEREEALQEVLPQWEAARTKEASEKRALDESNSRLTALYSKRGRASKFRTKAERDKYLKSEISAMEEYQQHSQAQALETAKTNLTSLREAKVRSEAQLTGLQDKVSDSRTRLADLAEQLSTLKDQQSELTERRKELWREDTKLESIVSRAADELRTVERALAGMLDKDTGMGLRAVDRIKERYGLDGVYGPLYRLFEVIDARFNTAIEQTAGNSLFHVVVDTDDTATKLLDIMLKEKTGRVTLMPLNRLKPKPPAPSAVPHHAQDAEPLLSKLRYDAKHEKAFQQVFGKTWVCRDLTVAAAYVKSHGINTITLDGDRVDRKGALTGGYHDVRRSRIEAIRNVAVWKDKFEAEDKRLKEVKSSILRVEQEVTQVTGKISVLVGQQTQVREARERVMEEGNGISREKDRVQERIVRGEKEVEELETERVNLKVKLDGYKQELGQPLVDGLTREEEDLVERLGKEVEKRRRKVVELGREKWELEKEKSALEIELNERLRRRREEVKARLEGMTVEDDDQEGGGEEEIKTRERELRVLNNHVTALTKRVKDLEKESEELTSSIATLRGTLEQLQNQQTEDSRMISRQQKTTERYLAKRQMLLARRDECNRSIRDLGVLPEEAFEKYINEKLDKLVKKLHNVNESLKKFAHVNKKAFEQYNNFTKQRDQLIDRREDLDKSAESIEELVQVLDQRKDEAIERTFKQVAKNFEEVFEKLVPAGRGRLIIQRRIDQDANGDAETDGEETAGEQDGTAVGGRNGNSKKNSVDNYTGVSIKVSFNSKSDEGLRISQLSGGQKSLVALALVFAIQKCDPAPFYLFDEIDANLDAQYRTAVASMIQSLSSTAQFITTTFRPEMLVTADKFYGVLFNNQKVSSIRAIKREEAMEFVEQEAQAQ